MNLFLKNYRINHFSLIFSIILSVMILQKQTYQQDQKFSPLQIPQKVTINAIKFTNSSSFQLNIAYSINSNASADTLFCFRQKSIINDYVTNTCWFDQNLNNAFFVTFQCFRIYNYSYPALQWRNSSYTAQFHQQDLFSVDYQTNIILNSLTLNNLTTNLTISNSQKSLSLPQSLFQIDKIYQLITCSNINFNNKICTQMRVNYIHTFLHENFVDNLIMQRNFNCFLHQQSTNKTVFLFTGGVVRQFQWYYFVAILVKQTGKLNMWGGISYSQSHTLSDMFGFSSNSGQYYDLFSLYASTPYQDTSLNINGTNDIILLSNSYDNAYKQRKHYYIQYYRLYDTGDSKSDDKIRQKIQIRYCFVAYFNDQNPDIVYSPLSKGQKHNMRVCWKPSLLLFEQILRNNFVLILITTISVLIIFTQI